ncbi:MAG: AAA family ATPase [Eubacterium sp.]|nr:AAA family ATPase [Eubacterium sp.]
MIKKLRLKNFKCFSNIEFELGNVTLLAGANGCGKSSLIHALLLLRQSIEQGVHFGSLYLYGKYIDLGFAKEIIYEDAEENELSIEIINEDGEHLKFAPKYEADKYILEVEKIESKDILKINKFNLFSSSFEYLSAERITPQNIFSAISFEEALGKKQYFSVFRCSNYGMLKSWQVC